MRLALIVAACIVFSVTFNVLLQSIITRTGFRVHKHECNKTVIIQEQPKQVIINEATITHIIIGMGKAEFLPRWNIQLHGFHVLYGAYNAEPQCAFPETTCLFIPGTTWTMGRNRLARHVYDVMLPQSRFHNVKYITLLDADVRLVCKSTVHVDDLRICLLLYREFLEKTQPPLAYVIGSDFVLDGAGPHSLGIDIDFISKMHSSHAFDAAFNTFHVDVLPIILPYDSRLDAVSWWISQAMLWQRVFCLKPLWGVAPLNIFYGNDGHEPYPRGRSMEKERNGHTAFKTRYGFVEEFDYPLDDYKPSWTSNYITKLALANWSSMPHYEACRERIAHDFFNFSLE